IDPWADAQGAGYQTVQSLIAVGSGGTHGLGFAQGRQKLLFLPFAHSDFIFAVVGEELGLVGASIIVFVFAIFLWRHARGAARSGSIRYVVGNRNRHRHRGPGAAEYERSARARADQGNS